MSDEHIDKLLGGDNDAELAAEVKAYEEEQTKEAQSEPEPEPVEEQEELELEAKEEVSDEEQPEPEPEEEKQPEAPKQVDLKALQAVRAENQQLKQQMNQLSLYMQQLQQNMTPQQQEEQEPVPDPDENPIEALSWLMKQQAQQAKTQQEQVEQQRQQAYQAQITQTYAQQAQQFEAQAPDFKDAYNHLIQNRAQELALAGMPQDQIAEQINREELSMAARAFQSGVNPAQQIYEMAKLRGYAPRAAQVQQQQPSAAERASMEEARRAAAINTNRSAPPAKSMTLEQIAELNGAAFDKALAKWERENGLGPKTVI